MANSSFGGKMTMKLGDGRVVKMRGTFTIHPTDQTVTTEKNLDRSFARIVALRNYRVETEFELAGTVSAADLIAYQGNLTVTEDHTDRTHLWTDGCFVGEPSTDQMGGKTTGLAFESVAYRVV